MSNWHTSQRLLAPVIALLLVACSGPLAGDGQDASSESAPKSTPNPACQTPSADDVPDCPTDTADVCAAIGYECGSVFANVGCGGQPELVDCGGCAQGYQCVEGSCACPEQFECGEVSSSCGGTTTCGECADGFGCGDDNTCYCEREPDDTLCERLGHECGRVRAEDICGSMVDADCGGCSSGVCSARSCQQEVVLEPVDVPAGEESARFGSIMAARPGFIAVSERYLDADGAEDAGAVRIFERQPDASWEPAMRLRAPNATADGLFGWNLAATDDYVFVSARRTQQGGSAVYVFAADADWRLSQTLRSPDPRSGRAFGADMSITPDGRLLVASRPIGDAPAPGRVDVLALDSGSWEPTGAIEMPDELSSEARFAQAVAASDELVFVSADRAELDGKAEVGVVYAYREDAPGWRLAAKMVPDAARSPMWFGHRLAWTDGSLLVAAPHDSYEAEGSGTVYVFGRDGTDEWSQQQALHDPEPRERGRFGHDLVALDSHAVVGLWDDESVFLFGKESRSWSLARAISAIDSDPDSWFGYRVAMLPDAVVVGEPKRGAHGAVRLYGLR